MFLLLNWCVQNNNVMHLIIITIKFILSEKSFVYFGLIFVFVGVKVLWVKWLFGL